MGLQSWRAADLITTYFFFSLWIISTWRGSDRIFPAEFLMSADREFIQQELVCCWADVDDGVLNEKYQETAS